MATMNQKNFSLSPAASDLGLGDMITQQLEDEEAERKKKALQATQNPQTLGPATMSLFSSGGAP